MGDRGARCPISGERIDENAARVNGAITCALLLLSVVTPAKWLLAYLAVDYAIKVFAGFAYSPNCMLARLVVDALRVPRVMTDAAPKRFAATVALFMCVAGVGALLAGSQTAFVTIVAVFGTCAALESGAGFCVGCYLFRLLPERAARAFVRRTAVEV